MKTDPRRRLNRDAYEKNVHLDESTIKEIGDCLVGIGSYHNQKYWVVLRKRYPGGSYSEYYLCKIDQVPIASTEYISNATVRGNNVSSMYRIEAPPHEIVHYVIPQEVITKYTVDYWLENIDLDLLYNIIKKRIYLYNGHLKRASVMGSLVFIQTHHTCNYELLVAEIEWLRSDKKWTDELHIRFLPRARKRVLAMLCCLKRPTTMVERLPLELLFAIFEMAIDNK